MGVINIVKTEKDVSKINDYMMYQERSVKKLDDLIQDILDLSRNSKLDVSIEPIEVKGFIANCIDSFSYMDEFKKVDVIVDVSDNFIIYSDTRRLKIVFNNILSNALRYSDQTKTHCYVKITASQNQEEIVFVFEDNGIGIKHEHLDKVFDMFYRATNHNTGSGLGLYIVKDTIDKLEGVIEISSDFGKSTRIQLVLPNRNKQAIANRSIR
jgi:signal transduction histidine kinase